VKKIIYSELSEDDPKLRKPDIIKAKKILQWDPTTNLENGLQKTFDYFKNKLLDE
jgi:nucleoside-diphosphate-sugar epimerase